MIACVDTSAILASVNKENHSPVPWQSFEKIYISRMVWIEVSRFMHRSRLNKQVSDETVSALHKDALNKLNTAFTVPLHETILIKAAEAFPTTVGSLDAIHLSTALMLRDMLEESPVLVTHDKQLAIAAVALGLSVVGV